MDAVDNVRAQFSQLNREVGPVHTQLIYLDSAASSLVPDCVVDAMSTYEKTKRSNIHRGIHVCAEESTDLYETARENLAAFIYSDPQNLVLTHGATESVNMVAQGWARWQLFEDDRIVLFLDNHHANIVPWQMLQQQIGFSIDFVEVDDEGFYDEIGWRQALEAKPKLVACTHVSNVMGHAHPVEQIVKEAHEQGATVLVDAAQSFGHLPLNVSGMGADMVVGSCHKAYGPFGIGFLYCEAKVLEELHPVYGGGNMIQRVTREGFTPAQGVTMLEAGTPTVSASAGLLASILFMEQVGIERIAKHATELRAYAFNEMQKLPHIRLFGDREAHHASLVTFLMNGIHPHDVAADLDGRGIAVRAGHHCCMPLHDHLRIKGSVRASFAIYNTREDVDELVAALADMKDVVR